MLGGGAVTFGAIFLFGTIEAGIYLYINGMVNDMKVRIEANNLDSSDEPHQSLHQMKIWSNYVREIKFHIEITK